MSKFTLSTLITFIKIATSLILVLGRAVSKFVDLLDDGAINESSEFSIKVNNFIDNYISFLNSFGCFYDYAMMESGKETKSFNDIVTSRLNKDNLKNIVSPVDISSAHAGLDYLHSEMYINESQKLPSSEVKSV